MRNRRGLSSVEYGLLIAAVALGLAAVMGFLTHGVSHRMKGGADAFSGGLLW